MTLSFCPAVRPIASIFISLPIHGSQCGAAILWLPIRVAHVFLKRHFPSGVPSSSVLRPPLSAPPTPPLLTLSQTSHTLCLPSPAPLSLSPGSISNASACSPSPRLPVVLLFIFHHARLSLRVGVGVAPAPLPVC